MGRKIICTILLVLIFLSLIIIVPIQLLLIQSISLTNINKSLSFTYAPSSPSIVEKLSINADKANVEIKYIDPNVDYYILIEVNITMIGVNIRGKSYEDYFDIQWDELNSPVSFTMEVISDEWLNPSLWIKKELNIVVYLRKDVTFDISATLNEGNVDLSIPFMVLINNIKINTTKGDISFNLNHCILQGNISCNSETGDLTLFTYNIQCTQDEIWNFTTEEGDLNIEIYQYNEIGANITGSIDIKALNLIYIDSSSNIGTLFTFPYSQWTAQGKIVTGFNDPVFFGNGFYISSSDFPATSNFNMVFYTSGYYDLELRNNYN